MAGRSTPRRGFTLIELLVTIVLIAILFGLLLTAVQNSREAGRRLHCANNLKQLGIALTNYATSTGCLPPGRSWNGFSLYVPLLPHLEQSALYNTMNMDAYVSIADDYPPGSAIDAHYTAAVTRLSVLVCPSDPEPSWRSATTNYAGNAGYGFGGSPTFAAGIFDSSSPASVAHLAQVADGTSNTVAISEWVRGPGAGVARDYRGNIYPIPRADDFGRFVEACDASVGVFEPQPSNGKRCFWMQTDLMNTLYNHNQGVGRPSCINRAAIPNGSWTAASQHPGGANALFVDGHVQFVKETMVREVWRGLGTRSRGEIIPDAY